MKRMSTLCSLFHPGASRRGRISGWLAPSSSWMLATCYYFAVAAHVVHRPITGTRSGVANHHRQRRIGRGTTNAIMFVGNYRQRQQIRVMSSTTSNNQEQPQQQHLPETSSATMVNNNKNEMNNRWLETASALPPPTYDPTRSYFPIYYNDVYEVNLPPHHRFPMAKYEQVRKLVQQGITVSRNDRDRVVCEFRVSPLATEDELTTTHSPDYVSRYLRGDLTERELRNVGFPWDLQNVRRSLSSTGGTVAAAKAVCEALRKRQHQQQQQQQQQMQQYDSRKPIIWAAHVAGGTHHAFYDRGEGFCVFSDIAVAANVILRNYPDVLRRILILDLDVHQGNGNAVLFQGRSDVITFSLHCEANYFSRKEHSDLDIELPAGCTDGTYLGTLQHWLRQLKRQGGGGDDYFDLVFFQAGVDVLEQDRLGRMSLTPKGVRRRNELVFDFCRELRLPLVLTMGGGYPQNEDSWQPILDAHANVYIQAWQYLQTNG